MSTKSDFNVETRGERDMVITRSFAAPRALVFKALTTPALLKRWLGAMEGWTFPECTMDARVGGTYRYVWHGPKGEVMGMGGVIREFKAPERIVATEKWDDPWYPGEAITAYDLVERNGRTALTLTVTYDTRQVRDDVVKADVTTGVAASYDVLEQVLSTL